MIFSTEPNIKTIHVAVNFMRCISHLINMIKLKVFQQKKQHSRYGFHYDFLKTNLQG